MVFGGCTKLLLFSNRARFELPRKGKVVCIRHPFVGPLPLKLRMDRVGIFPYRNSIPFQFCYAK